MMGGKNKKYTSLPSYHTEIWEDRLDWQNWDSETCLIRGKTCWRADRHSTKTTFRLALKGSGESFHGSMQQLILRKQLHVGSASFSASCLKSESCFDKPLRVISGISWVILYDHPFYFFHYEPMRASSQILQLSGWWVTCLGQWTDEISHQHSIRDRQDD